MAIVFLSHVNVGAYVIHIMCVYTIPSNTNSRI